MCVGVGVGVGLGATGGAESRMTTTPTAQLHRERLVPMPSRNRRPCGALDMSLGGGAWVGFLSTGCPRAGTTPAERPRQWICGQVSLSSRRSGDETG